MKIYKKLVYMMLGFSIILSCKTPPLESYKESFDIPSQFKDKSQDSLRLESWNQFFKDPYLKALIDSALVGNQELAIVQQELKIAKNEVYARSGEYLPFLTVNGGASLEKAGRYTWRGSTQATTEIKPGREMPEPLPDFLGVFFASWEIDIWHRLRNAKKAANLRYLATEEGKNFTTTNLVAEVANIYFELLALDAELAIILQNIEVQSNALKIVKQQKEAARTTELAVKRFEAQVINTKSLQYNVLQEIVQLENEMNFLLGRTSQKIERSREPFLNTPVLSIQTGFPLQLLQNRPDIRRAELELAASKINVEVAKANFYPSLGLTAGVGLQSFNPILLVNPRSILSSLAADLVGPLLNKRAIEASYKTANAQQIQAIYSYRRTFLNALFEVVNHSSRMENLQKIYELKMEEVQVLNQSVNISNNLFSSARADYMEVLLTQRDALEAKFEQVETKRNQLHASVNTYRALGGGW